MPNNYFNIFPAAKIPQPPEPHGLDFYIQLNQHSFRLCHNSRLFFSERYQFGCRRISAFNHSLILYRA